MEQPILITGGAGFIGTNAAKYFASRGRDVLLLDNLSRPGVRDNLDWLQSEFGERIELLECDIRDADAVSPAIERAGAVLHFAAQVAVTTSLISPLEDFEINARGTLNLLEAIRQRRDRTGTSIPLLFTSTNKVYGDLGDLEMRVQGQKTVPNDAQIAQNGISEARPLDFHSPYGCSKGAADQYVLDYARTFDLPFCVFRMSCVYGPHQKGTEDQGWVAHFLLQALRGEEITLFGDGKQVRDILFVEDAIAAFALGLEHIETLAGRAFNLGGGARNAVSLLEVVDFIEEIGNERPRLDWGD
ncbi:MAG TPA: SDR family NAD(P)-dependent oxidoreductase, partial [Abditibacterium sp.]